MAAKLAVAATVRTVLGSKKPSILKAPLTLTDAAVNRVRQLLKDQPDARALRISVRTRGCNGLAYALEYVNEKQKLDEEVNCDGIKIFIDKKAQLSLLGTEMDFCESKLTSEFVFSNPNIKGTCGCGESFNL